MGYSPWGGKESDTTKWLTHSLSLSLTNTRPSMLLPPGGEILPVEGGLDSATNKESMKQKTSHFTEETLAEARNLGDDSPGDGTQQLVVPKAHGPIPAGGEPQRADPGVRQPRTRGTERPSQMGGAVGMRR